MTKQTVPVVGDRLSDGFPSIEKIVKCTFGATSGEVTCDTSGVFAVCTLPAFAQLTDVGWMVEAKFNDDVGIAIGDTDDPNGWAEIADVLATVADTLIYWSSRFSGAASTATDSGPVYAITPPTWTDCEETINCTVSTGVPTTGKLAIYVKYHMAYAQKYF